MSWRPGPGLAALACSALALVPTASCSLIASPRPTEGLGGPVAGWHDPFAGPTLDPSRWTTCYWWAQGGCTIASNDEQEWYQPSQVSVRGGVLRLEARASTSPHGGRTYPYVSGMVSSGRSGDGLADRARLAFTYGTVTVRFRTPAGHGLWPAIWMLPATNQPLPEIDLLEQHGDEPRRASMNLHVAGPDGVEETSRQDVVGDDLSSGWHTVRLAWTPGHLSWWLDGVLRHHVDGALVPSQPMYLIINLAVGGRAGAVDTSRLPAALLVDDVQVSR